VIDENTRIVVGANVTSGEVNDAIPGKEVLEEVINNELVDVDEILGDTAYSGQPILEMASKYGVTLIAPPHPNLGKKH